ncbi:MAG: hypothetical protein RLZZ488_863 [Pseudomonadota bacterium]|jgi:hypothetical protein
MKSIYFKASTSVTNLVTALVIATLPTGALAGGKGHKAHEHGTASVNIVGEANTVTIQLESPSEAIYGFEHEAKKPADIKKRDEAVEKLKASADKMFVLDSSLACKLTEATVNPFVTEAEETKETKKNKHKKGTHSEVHAKFKFECAKPVAGSEVKFATKAHFKSLRKLKVQTLSGETQSGSTVVNDAGSAKL